MSIDFNTAAADRMETEEISVARSDTSGYNGTGYSGRGAFVLVWRGRPGAMETDRGQLRLIKANKDN